MDFIPEHEDFTIEVKNPSFDPAQCGEIQVTPKYEGVPLTGSEILKYNNLVNRFSIETDDYDLNGMIKKYSLNGKFKDYAGTSADEEEVEAEIRFEDPCLSPVTF